MSKDDFEKRAFLARYHHGGIRRSNAATATYRIDLKH